MDDSSPPPPPAPIVIQQPPPISQSSQEASTAAADSLQALLQRGLLPQYAQTLTDIQKQQAPQLGQINVDTQKQFAPQLTQIALDQLKQADPTGFSIRQAEGNTILGQLSPEQFGKLSPQEKQDLEENVRSSQVARGGGTGLGDSIQEALAKYNLGTGIQQRQLSNAGSFLAGTPPQASFGALNQAGQTSPVGTQNVQGIASQLFPSPNALIGQQISNFGQSSANANALNGLSNNQYQFGVNNTTNPFLTGLSFLGGLGGQVVGGLASGGFF